MAILVRNRPTSAPGPAPSPRLSDLRRGDSAVVVGIEGAPSPAVACRLRAMGLRPGASVTCVRRAPLGSPVVYRVGEIDLCLRSGEAGLVEVCGER